MFGAIAGFKGERRQKDFVMFLSLKALFLGIGLSWDQEMRAEVEYIIIL